MDPTLDFLTDTLIHIDEVRQGLERFCHELRIRGLCHDRSKLQEPEFGIFCKTRLEFKKANYGTPEYEACIDKARVAVDHHHQVNRHHTTFFPNGVLGMNLMDIVEMLADWKAAARRSPDFSFVESLPKAFLKYKISGSLQAVILNTVKDLGWYDEDQHK